MKKIVLIFLATVWTAYAQEGATFKEGEGLRLSEKTGKAIGLETTEVVEKSLIPDVRLTGQIYREAHEKNIAYASAWIDPETISLLKQKDKILVNTSITGRVAAIENTEALIEISDPNQLFSIGSFVEIQTLEQKPILAVAVPRSSILEAASGTFVYVKNGDSLLRTAIETGIQNESDIEIRDGLYEGDEVASKAVETLYLIELRATKGGGHCH